MPTTRGGTPRESTAAGCRPSPNAKYVFARTEVEYAESAGLPQYPENVLPVIEAGQAVIVESDYALDDSLWLEPLPGHTPGHVAVHLRSAGDHAVM